MNKAVLNSLLAAGLMLVTSLGATETKRNVKLLESMTDSNGKTTKFEYDNQNRIIEIHHYENDEHTETETLTYSGNDLVNVSGSKGKSFEREGNTISTSDYNYRYSITVNRNGYITRVESTTGYDYYYDTYHYNKNNNLTKITQDMSLDGEAPPSKRRFPELKYDSRKSPFFNCSTPKWFFQHHYGFGYYRTFGLNNNVIEHKLRHGDVHTYKYEYDRDGFPTKETRTEKSSDGTKSTTTTTFTYYSK